MKTRIALRRCILTKAQGRYYADGYLITKKDYTIAKLSQPGRIRKAAPKHPDHERPEPAIQAA